MNNLRKNSQYIHAGQSADLLTGAVSVPIYQTSTFKQIAPGEHKGYEYSRSGNPTRNSLEEAIAVLEGGTVGLAFASGLAALSTTMALFNYGDHFIVSEDVYGGTFRILDKVFSRFGMQFDFVDTTNIANIEAAYKDNTKAVIVESPTNPLLSINDLAAIAQWAKRHDVLTIVDNTFLTPYWQKPLKLGADIVLHSATKYIGGHSDVVAGLAVVLDGELGRKLKFLQNAMGAVLGPNDAWLLLRGLKTLPIRMQTIEKNANVLAKWLGELPQIAKVYYPGLPEHPNHAIAVKQASGFGGIISFEMQNDQAADQLLRNVKLITLAESLGAVESLISLPAKMTHASIPAEIRYARGISDSLVRLSVGIEDVEDIKTDILQALEE